MCFTKAFSSFFLVINLNNLTFTSLALLGTLTFVVKSWTVLQFPVHLYKLNELEWIITNLKRI